LEKYKNTMDKSEKQYAFIDEYGNYGFNFEKKDVSSHFIITSIIVPESKLETMELAVEYIRKKHFQTGEIKSSKIGNNHKRREKILSEISLLDFHYYSVVIDKKRIFTDSGLMYKGSFIKYLNSMLHKELKHTFPKLQLISDNHGKKEFMDGFVKYVNERNQPNLFEEYEFGFCNSKSSVLVQLADLISGTIAFNYEKSKDNSVYENFKPHIVYKMIGLVKWPIRFEQYIHEYEKHNKGIHDDIIYSNSIRLVIDFIKENEGSEVIEVREQVYVLKYLLTMLLMKNNSRYISSRELIDNLKILLHKDYTRHYFKTRVIAKLRDKGILISSSNKGYKIPESENDIYSFVNQTNSMIQPMLSRLSKARKRILAATKNELDILDKHEYAILKKYIE